MRLRRWHKGGPALKCRCWFQHSDGTYYRNLPLIMSERDQAMAQGEHDRVTELHAEFDEVFRFGVARKAELDPGDVLVQPAKFRDAYPDRPGLWVLDDPSS